MQRKRINYSAFSLCWEVWDKQRKEVVGYFKTKREAELCASQLELF